MLLHPHSPQTPYGPIRAVVALSTFGFGLGFVLNCSPIGSTPGGDGDGNGDGDMNAGDGDTGGGVVGDGDGDGDSPTGSGGALATGGAAGVGGSPAAGGSGGSPGGDPCTTAALCDDFEGGMDPAWSIQMDSQPQPVVDTTKGANGSSSSLRTTGTTQQSFVTFPVPGQQLYVRTYMNFENATSTISPHGWYIVGADNVTSGGGAQMRFGSSGNHGHGSSELDFNVYNGGCTGEKTQFSDGASDGNQGWGNTTDDVLNFEANTWYCVETYFNGTGHEFRFWVDGTEHQGLHVTEATMCDAWAPTYTHVKLGAGANGDVGDVWFDDVVISTSPIGCN